MKTNQETFDEMVQNVKEQKQPCLVDGECKYLTPSGNKCIVGGLIPVDRYTVDMEDKTADAYPVYDILESLGHDSEFCRDVQTRYDRLAMTSKRTSLSWQDVLKDDLRNFAQKLGLKLNW